MPRSIQLALLLLAVSLSGCGKKKTVAPQAPPATASEQAPAETSKTPTVAAPAEGASPTAPLDGIVDPIMTSQLRAFMQQNGRLPKDFNELRRTSLDSVTRMPAGKKWVIDPTTAEVKLVKQ